MNQHDEFKRQHPWRMAWELFLLVAEEFIWRFNPGRNRFCDRCSDFTGNNEKQHKAHRCSGQTR